MTVDDSAPERKKAVYTPSRREDLRRLSLLRTDEIRFRLTNKNCDYDRFTRSDLTGL